MESAVLDKLIYEGDTVVYKGTYSGQDVAVKYTLYDAAEDGNLIRESKVAAKARKYVNTPAVYFYGEFFEEVALVVGDTKYSPLSVTYFEWVTGSTLQKLVIENRLTTRMKRKVALGMIAIVTELHKHGVLHGDMYLVNWMLNSNDALYIIDFGGGSLVDHPVVYDQIESYTIADALTNLKYGTSSGGGIIELDLKQDKSPFRKRMTVKELGEVVERIF